MKNFHMRSESDTLLQVQLKVSSEAHMFHMTSYMLTNWLIDVGGISRALYFGGLMIAHFVALRAYKAALIGDVFMV